MSQSEQELLHLFRSSWLWILAEVESLMPLHFTRPSRRPRGVSLLEEINTAIQLEETAILQGEIRMLAQDPEFESLSLKGIRKKLAERLEWDAAWHGPILKFSRINKTVKQLVIQTMQSDEYQRREFQRWPAPVSAERRARARARRAVLTAASLHPAAGAAPVWVERYSSQPLRRGTYWTNTQTGESTWQQPNPVPQAPGLVAGY